MATGFLGSMFMRINGDTNVSNYATSYFYGDGATTGSGTLAINTGRSALLMDAGISQNNPTYPIGNVFDLLDYSNTNKFKTARGLPGADTNGNGPYVGSVGIVSGLYLSTSAISSLDFFLDGGNPYATNTKIALYGIKG
jgi:hypothetical protein